MEGQHENFVAAMTEWGKGENGENEKVKMSGSEKKVNDSTYDISPKQRVNV